MTVQRTKTSDFTNTLTLTASIVATTAVASKLDSMIRQGDPVWSAPTNAKMQRTGCYALATILPFVTSILTNDSMATAVSLVGSVASVFLATQIRDYEDNKECNAYRREAQNLTFYEILEKHGLENLSHLQIPNLQEKFANTFVGQSFKEIISKFPLKTIHQYQLASAQFMHKKFIEEARSKKLHFINQCRFSDEYKQFLLEERIQKFISIQKRFRAIPNLQWTLNQIGMNYQGRAEILQAEFETKKSNIPLIARSLAGDKVRLQNLKKQYELDLNNALMLIHERYPNRTTELNKKYEQEKKDLEQEARQVGKDAMLAHLATSQPSPQNMGPQTVRETRANLGMREAVGSRTNTNRVSVGNRENIPDHILSSADHVGKIAQQNYFHRQHEKLKQKYSGILMHGITQQNLYNQAVVEANQNYTMNVASLKYVEANFIKQEEERLFLELDHEMRAKLPYAQKQQQSYDQAIDTACRKNAEDIRDLEEELEQALHF